MTSSCPRNSNWMCEPALMPNLARMAAGKVTCPLLETMAWACILIPLLLKSKANHNRKAAATQFARTLIKDNTA
jgi:hypothetical protein